MPKRHLAATEQVSIVVGEVVVLKTAIDLLVKNNQVQLEVNASVVLI